MRLSDHYELQSMVDIGRAQAIARTDQSGHALGTAMYLAQQSVEKQLKSIMVRLDETLNLGHTDKILRGLSHEFYPLLYESYRLHIECSERAIRKRYGVKASAEGFKYTESVADDFREASAYWNNYCNDPDILRLTWLQSLNAGLSREDLHRLNLWHGQQMTFAPGNALGSGGGGGVGGGDPKLEDVFPPSDLIRIEIWDDHALARHSVEYAETPANMHMRMSLAGTLETTNPDRLQMLGVEHADLQSELARMGLFEFGFHVMASMTHHYVLLYPHNPIGRYPEPAGDGLFTPDIYERQADDVLTLLFVVVPYRLRQLRMNSGIIDKRSEHGRQRGYWKGGRAAGRGSDARRGSPRARRGGATKEHLAGRAGDMDALVSHYARQADSDLKHAHAAARADRSGYALADAMLLGQQSLEMHLKASVFMMAGMLGADGAAGIPKAREHDVYRWIFGLYARHVGRIHVPRANAALGALEALDFESHALAVERSACFWERYSKGGELRMLAWRHSIGAPLGDGGQARLNVGLLPCAAETGNLVGNPCIGIPRLSRESSPGESLLDEALCPRALAARMRAHMKSPWNSGVGAAVGQRFAECRKAMARGAGEGDVARAGLRRRLTGEFCLLSLVMLAPGYLYAYPHNYMGRYPGDAGGGTTTDLYRLHADGVRHLLLVDIPCQAWQVARVAALTRALWREGGGAASRSGG
ncbi:MAG: hypothetical protein OXU25_00815 [Thaumarchaeota archaeon]|nr:hypothetical protein [Nitrososphaerota archaeon]